MFRNYRSAANIIFQPEMSFNEMMRHIKAHFDGGRFKKARKELLDAMERFPKNGLILFRLGQVCAELNALEEAEGWLWQAIKIDHETAEIHKTLADVQAELGKNAEAKASYKNAIELDSRYFNPHANLANLLLDEGDIEAAITHYQRAIELRPDIAELYDSLGQTLRETEGASQAARAMFLQALKLNPELATAHFNLARNMEQSGQLQMAVQHYQQAIKLAPDLKMAQARLSGALIKLGETEQALLLIRELESGQDRIPLETLQHLYADLAAKEGLFDEALVMRQALLEQLENDSEARRAQYVLLAELYDEMSSYAAAFEALERAHAINQRQYDFEAVLAEFDLRRNAYGPYEMASLPRADSGLKQPIFLFGMPRAGKSLAESLLSLSPQVHGLDELLSVTQVKALTLEKKRGEGREEIVKALSVGELNQIAIEYIDIAEEYLDDVGLSFANGLKHVVSTTPDNFWDLPLIHRLFPEAPLIHITRHPLDTCLACFFKEFGNGVYAFTNSLKDLGAYFVKYQEMVSCWRDTHNIPMLEVCYEDMVRNPVSVQAKLFAYVGLEAPNQEIREAVSSLGFSASQVGRWRHYELQIKPLKDVIDDWGAFA